MTDAFSARQCGRPGCDELVPCPVHGKPDELEHLGFVLTALTTALTRLAGELRWAHSNGYLPAGHAVDAEHGRDTSKDEDERLKVAPSDDFGVGDHRARKALARALPILADGDVRLMFAAWEASVFEQPAIVHPNGPADLAAQLLAVEAARWRVDAVRTRVRSIDRDHRRRVVAHLEIALEHVDKATTCITYALGRGDPPTTIPASRLCRICGTRPRGDKKGKRCNICFQYQYRYGIERPRSLDAHDEARDAAARRRARGEGWGDESFSGARRRGA